MFKKPYLSIVIPSYNEMENLKRGVLDEVLHYLKNQNYDWELILSDDESSDGTIEFLEKFAKKHAQIKVIKNRHKGKGPTVKAGILQANGQWRLYTDFDQSTPIQEVKKLLKYTDRYQVIIGSREIKGALRAKEPFYRHLMGRGFNFLVRFFAVRGLMDTQCGFKLFSEEAAEKLFKKLYVYGGRRQIRDAFTGAFDVELLYLARKFDFKIKEVAIKWKHFKTERVSPIKDSFRMFRDILRIRKADILRRYA
ncbi:MAG: glycosyltransferase family 2 protein [Candidatus Woesebacteria bacterium]|jgi:glycosyltransferase involved in cell wall biosynthesis